MTREQAQLVVEEYYSQDVLGDDAEMEFLEQHAPNVLYALRALITLANEVE